MMPHSTQRLYASYNQCVTRVAQAVRQMIDLNSFHRYPSRCTGAGTESAPSQSNLQHQGQVIEQIRHTLYDMVQDKMDNLEERFRKFTEFTHEVTATIDRNEHGKCSSIGKTIHEQEDVRRLVEELARRLDHTPANVVETKSESSVATQLEISDLKAKVLRLTEQYTEHDAKVNSSQPCQNGWLTWNNRSIGVRQEKARVDVRIRLLRANWARRGRELHAIKHSD